MSTPYNRRLASQAFCWASLDTYQSTSLSPEVSLNSKGGPAASRGR